MNEKRFVIVFVYYKLMQLLHEDGYSMFYNVFSPYLKFYDAFPPYLKSELDIVLRVLPKKSYCINDFGKSEKNYTFETIKYKLSNCNIKFPYRVYIWDVTDRVFNKLNSLQKIILCCIYTRSCDGYIREKYLRKLLDINFDEWVIPYIIKLCDEYVLEIVEVIYEKLKNRDNADIKDFCKLNKSNTRTGYSRMISYWDAYYRRKYFIFFDRRKYYSFEEYIGRKLFVDCLGYDKSFEK